VCVAILQFCTITNGKGAVHTILAIKRKEILHGSFVLCLKELFPAVCVGLYDIYILRSNLSVACFARCNDYDYILFFKGNPVFHVVVFCFIFD
jgi:hypothetical protein